MNKLNLMKKRDGFLNGVLLVAMPTMEDERFSRSVIYICAHSDSGAMGIILNQKLDIRFCDILVQLDIIKESEAAILPPQVVNLAVRKGGPVDSSRGFLLHSDDYRCESTMPIAEDINLTATVDILRAIYAGEGPSQVIMALGYSGWDAGQLENEIAANSWLTVPASRENIFNTNFDHYYDRCLDLIGIKSTHFISDAGHA